VTEVAEKYYSAKVEETKRKENILVYTRDYKVRERE
jgi:hypothetical protein